MKFIQYLCVFVVFGCSSSWAQESDSWDWKIAPYLWTVGISGDLSIGDIDQDLDVSFSDILSDFDFGGSIFSEFGKGNHAVHIDYTYLRLKPDPTEFPSPPFPPDSTLSTKMTINIFEPAYNYRWDGPGGGAIVLGARYMDIEMRMTPDLTGPGPIAPDPVEVGPSWWDYFIGVKTHNRISTNWDFDFYGTIGAGDSDLPWTLQAMFGRRFSNDNRLGIGVRVWGIDFSENEGLMEEYTRIDATFYGLLIGYEFN
jgi:hypothetical protein